MSYSQCSAKQNSPFTSRNLELIMLKVNKNEKLSGLKFETLSKFSVSPGVVKHQSCDHIKTSQLICSANQLTGFYMMTILACN